jgi:hypothetical protein
MNRKTRSTGSRNAALAEAERSGGLPKGVESAIKISLD